MYSIRDQHKPNPMMQRLERASSHSENSYRGYTKVTWGG